MSDVRSTPVIEVLAAVITRDDKFLVCLRPIEKRHGGLWQFPGGRVEVGETLHDAARRELAEDLNVDVVRVGEPIFSAHDAGSPFVINLVPTEIAGEPDCLEHAELQWSTLSELQRLNLVPSSGRFVRFMLARR